MLQGLAPVPNCPRRQQTPDIQHFAQDMSLPPLATVPAFCRVRFPRLLALPHVVGCISDFADCTHEWTVVDACKSGSLRLVRRVAFQQRKQAPKVDPLYHEWDFNKGLEIAAARGDLAMVQWLVLECLPGAQITRATKAAVENGHTRVLSWLLRDDRVGDVVFDPSMVELAAENGHIQTVQWVRETYDRSQWQAFDVNHKVFQKAPLRYLQWAILQNDRRYVSDAKELINAARCGRLDVVQWFVGLLDDIYKNTLLRRDLPHTTSGRALRSGSIHNPISVKFPYKFYLDEAADGGDVETIEWVTNASFPWMKIEATPFSTVYAARSGQLCLVKWLLANRSERFPEGYTGAFDAAGWAGNLEMIKWFHFQTNERCTVKAMDRAASRGFLDIVKFLHEHRSEGCTTKAMDEAAANGHFEVIEFLRDNRMVGSTTKAIDGAAGHGHLGIVAWLERYYSLSCTTNAMDNAASAGRLDMIKWLHENRSVGCTTGAMDCAAERGDLEMVKWLHENRTEGCTTGAMDRATKWGRFDVLLFLHANRTEGCSGEAFVGAIQFNRYEIFRWLMENCHERFDREYVLRKCRDDWMPHKWRSMRSWLREHYNFYV